MPYPEILSNTKIFQQWGANQYWIFCGQEISIDYTYNQPWDEECCCYYDGYCFDFKIGERSASFMEILDHIIDPEVQREILFHLDGLLVLERDDW